jgi:hypothetical protein
MHQLTLREIPPELEREIRRTARMRGLSINRTVKALLAEALGILPTSEKRRDLSALSGTWSDAEAAAFESATEFFGRIDDEVWE